MPNPNYVKGRRKEYKIVNDAKAKGFLAFRSAGSHSPIDVVIIDLQEEEISFIQCKPDSISEKEKNKLRENLKRLNGFFLVDFEVL